MSLTVMDSLPCWSAYSRTRFGADRRTPRPHNILCLSAQAGNTEHRRKRAVVMRCNDAAPDPATGAPLDRYELRKRSRRLRRYRIEQREQQQAGNEPADMGLPGDALLAAGQADRPDAEQHVQAEPSQ